MYIGYGSCFGCGKGGHKVKDCPNIATRDGKQVAPNVPKDDSQKKRRF